MSEREEYTTETYPSFGKKYNGEKAIISLTSWKARINTVSKTLYSLLKQCPGFHIVLVLSEEEFPKMMDELPDNLKLFVNNEVIELMFVWKNYKSFKKVLFTMDKYRDVPVISADDDLAYKENYAESLFNIYKKERTMVCSYGSYKYGKVLPHGFAVLYPPHSIITEKTDFTKILFILSQCQKQGFLHDDALLGTLYYKNGNKMAISLNKRWQSIAVEHSPNVNAFNGITNGKIKKRTVSQLMNERKNIIYMVNHVA